MGKRMIPVDEKYHALASPFNSLEGFTEASHEQLLLEESEVLDGTVFSRLGQGPYQRGTQFLSVGELVLIAGRTTPVLSRNVSAAFSCFFAMPFMGGFTTTDGSLCDEVGPGDLYLNQNYYGTSKIGYLSSLFVALDQKRLDRAMGSISGGLSLSCLDSSIIAKPRRGGKGPDLAGKLWSLIAFIDHLHAEAAAIPSILGLDEQFYRLLALALLEASGRSDDVGRHWQGSASDWTNPLDDLVDYIRANAHANLTLTDLEERSHYSARHLQNLFKQKFQCTPMQFVRRQRLAMAMEKLQAAGWSDSVTSIARACGYRHVCNFSSDFQRQFGVAPSVLLRASRSGGGLHQSR